MSTPGGRGSRRQGRGPDPLSELELDFTPPSAREGSHEPPEFVQGPPIGSRIEADLAEEAEERRVRAARAPKQRAARPGGQGSETMMRFLVAVPLGVLAIVMIVVGGAVFATGMLAFACVAMTEFFSMAARTRPFVTVAVVVAAGLILAAYFGSQYQMMYALLAAIPLMFVAGAMRPSVEGLTLSLAVTTLGIVWIAVPFAHAVLLRQLPHHGAALLTDVLIATIVSDTAAYAGGRLIGQHRLAPRLSPNKTIEGLACGFIGGTLGFWFAGLYQDWLPGIDALAMGAAIAVLAPIGDLFQSMIKRDLGVKDASSILGPHGGVLDRLDAVLFTVVAGYYLSVLFVY